jgi:hypothetical protein
MGRIESLGLQSNATMTFSAPTEGLAPMAWVARCVNRRSSSAGHSSRGCVWRGDRLRLTPKSEEVRLGPRLGRHILAFAFIFRHTSSRFKEGELLQMIPVAPGVEVLSSTTEFSFATGELNFEVL